MHFALLILLNLAVHAKEPETRIDVNPSVYPTSGFRGRGDVVRPFPKTRSPESVPDREFRDRIFGKVKGLSDHVKALDELDRDLLLLRAKKQTLPQLKALYPGIPEPILAQLRSEARRTR